MNELLSSGIELMLLGMGIVYGFLGMLVIAIRLMSRFVERYFPDMPSHPAVSNYVEDAGIAAAISAAIHQYRKKYSKN
jgi:oxaloacetate decarboxylase (Na+ extruding) subunit gamma